MVAASIHLPLRRPFIYSPSVTLSTLGLWEYGRFLYTCSMIFSFTCEMVSQLSTLTGVTSGPSPCTRTCNVWRNTTQEHSQSVTMCSSHAPEHTNANYAEIFKHGQSTQPPTRTRTPTYTPSSIGMLSPW